MGPRVPVATYAADPILRFGVAHQLRPRPEVELLGPDEEDRAKVALVVVDQVDEDAVQLLLRLRRSSAARTALVVGRFEGAALRSAIECGVAAVLRRSEADQDRLVAVVTAVARGEGVLPGDLLGQLLDHVGQLQRAALDPRGVTLSTLAAREVDVLRLVSEGFDTNEIADKLSYSERTIKNILYEINTRLRLRNRAHAVGYAMRNGLI
ncbi:response regulator transcription factor [Solihabitans fulvus]|uniref:Response regulator transcription factor n=1 Tax=Solihabitans fulvus TaxID=1892852 RepID=A0A5B2X497_9PSEU|nr:response regulator transcription factor [Solihabitans fulvus]KAA2258076.1 response regulator transcription factor [Solihabitans fulvus]